MKVFVWRQVEDATDSFHSEGGVVVFAETEDRARELAAKPRGSERWPERGANIKPGEAPDEVREVTGGEERVFIMPNAGCC